jgi:hypothetical protein
MGFIYDNLLQPPHPSSQHSKNFKQKRLLDCIQPISYLLTRHIETSRPDLHEWLNRMEMMNCAVLNQSASRDYRMYQIWTMEKSDIDYILIILMENIILSKCQDKYIYEEWLAEKSMFLLATVRQIHLEHTRHQPVFQKLIDDSDGLYS